MNANQSDFKKAVPSDFIWTILNQIVLSAGAIAIIIVLSNVLEAQTFGKTRFLVAILSVFAFFSLPGIGPVVLQQMPIYSYDGFKQALKTQFKWGAGASIGAFLLALVFYLQGDRDLTKAFLVAGVLAPIANLYLMPGIALAGLHKFRLKTICDGVIVTSVTLGVWYGAVTTDTVYGTMLWYYCTQSFITIIALFVVKKHLVNTPGSAYDFEADTKFGKQLTLFQLSFTLLPALEKVLIFIFLGPAALTLYIIAFLPIEHIRNAYRNVLQIFVLPKLQLSGYQSEDLGKWFNKAVVLSFGSVFVIAFFAFFLLPVFFPQYGEASNLMLLSTMIPLALPAHVYVLKMLSDRRTERLYSYTMVTVIIDILIFTILTPAFGLSGAITAKIVTSFVAAGVAYVLYKQKS